MSQLKVGEVICIKGGKSEVECPNQLVFEQAQKMAIASKAGVWK